MNKQRLCEVFAAMKLKFGAVNVRKAAMVAVKKIKLEERVSYHIVQLGEVYEIQREHCRDEIGDLFSP